MVAKESWDMKEKQKKPKEGLARLIELAGGKRKKLIAASCLSVISALSRIVFFFTIYGVIREILQHYNTPEQISMDKILLYIAVTATCTGTACSTAPW